MVFITLAAVATPHQTGDPVNCIALCTMSQSIVFIIRTATMTPLQFALSGHFEYFLKTSLHKVMYLDKRTKGLQIHSRYSLSGLSQKYVQDDVS